MKTIIMQIKDANLSEVEDFLHTHSKSAVKSSLYYKLLKLYEIYKRAVKLSKHTWYKNCKMPEIEQKDWNALCLNQGRASKLYEEIDILNGIIYHQLINLDEDIQKYMINQYSLGRAYQQASRDYLPSMFDRDSIKAGLKSQLSVDMMQDNDVSKNVMDAYYYLIELQTILQKIKSRCINQDVEQMLKLVNYTKAQLKQILDDLGYKMYLSSHNTIELEKRSSTGKNKHIAYLPAQECMR